jgi:hypothetical protein
VTITPDADLPVWTFRHNWSEKIVERLSWLSRVFASRLGAEQTMGIRLSPRRSVEINALIYDTDRTYFDLKLSQFGRSDWLFPLLYNGTKLISAGIGDTTLVCNTQFRDFTDGGYALVLGRNARDFERVQIDTVSSGSLTLVDPLGKAFVGAMVYPLVRAYLDDQPTATRLSSRVWTAPVRFYQCDGADRTVTTTFETYSGVPVLPLIPDESDSSDFNFLALQAKLDNMTGRRLSLDTAARGFDSQQVKWTLHGRAEHTIFRDLLYTLAGRQFPLWVPTYSDDLILVASTSSGSADFTVAAVGISEMGGLVQGRKFVRFTLNDGSTYIRQILGVAAGVGDTEVISVNLSLGVTVNPTDVIRLEFLQLMRQDIDDIEIAHLTDEDGTSQVATVFRNFNNNRQELTDNFVAIPTSAMTDTACTDEGCIPEYSINYENQLTTALRVAEQAGTIGTSPYYDWRQQTDFATGTLYYAATNSILYSESITPDAPNTSPYGYQNTTGRKLWTSPRFGVEPGDYYDPGVYGTMHIFEKNLTTGAVTDYGVANSFGATLPDGGGMIDPQGMYGWWDFPMLDQASGDLWLIGPAGLNGVDDPDGGCVYPLRRADGYKPKILGYIGQYPGTSDAELAPDLTFIFPELAAISQDWVFIIQSDPNADVRIVLLPRTDAAEEIAAGRKLPAAIYPGWTGTFTYADYYTFESHSGSPVSARQMSSCLGPDGALYLAVIYETGAYNSGNWQHVRVFKLTPPTAANFAAPLSPIGGGWEEITAWTTSEGPTALTKLEGVADQALMYLKDSYTLLLTIRSNGDPTGVTADETVSYTYLAADGSSWSHFNTGYWFDANWVSAGHGTTPDVPPSGDAVYATLTFYPTNPYLDMSPICSPSERWFIINAWDYTVGGGFDIRTDVFFVRQKFTPGVAPVVQEVIRAGAIYDPIIPAHIPSYKTFDLLKNFAGDPHAPVLSTDKGFWATPSIVGPDFGVMFTSDTNDQTNRFFFFRRCAS